MLNAVSCITGIWLHTVPYLSCDMPPPDYFLIEVSKLREANQQAQRMLDQKEKRGYLGNQAGTVNSLADPPSPCDDRDIWGAGEYLSTTCSNINYAKEHLKHSQEILRKSHALLRVPRKCNYEIVESTEELIGPKANFCHQGHTNKTTNQDRISEFNIVMPGNEDGSFKKLDLSKANVATDDRCTSTSTSMTSSHSNMISASHGHLQQHARNLMEIFPTENDTPQFDDPLDGICKDKSFLDEILKENESELFLASTSPFTGSPRDYSDVNTSNSLIQGCSRPAFNTLETQSNSSDLGGHHNNAIAPPEKEIIPCQKLSDMSVMKHKLTEQEFKLSSETSSLCNETPELGQVEGGTHLKNVCRLDSESLQLEADGSLENQLKFTTAMSNVHINDESLNIHLVDLVDYKIGRVQSPEKQSTNNGKDQDKGQSPVTKGSKVRSLTVQLQQQNVYEMEYPKQPYAMFTSLTNQNIWDSLPNEIILHIFSFLGKNDLKQVALVCHRFHAIATDHCLWFKLDVDNIEITPSWLDRFTRVRQLKIIHCKAKRLGSKALRTFFQNSKDTLKTIHLSQCSDKYLQGDNILLHVSTHCSKVTSVSLPWSNTTDNGIDALAMSGLVLDHLDVSGNCFISDCSLVKLLQRTGESLRVLKLNGCFALTKTSFSTIADHCQGISILEMGLCPKIGRDSITSICLKLKELRELDLRGLSAVDDFCLSCISRTCKLLTTLILANCKSLSDNGISNLVYDLPDITTLDLSGCPKISDTGCCNLAHALRSPIHLDFSSTAISHTSILVLTQNFYHSLQVLKINFCNNITQECLKKLISFCFKLKSLQVHGCKRVDVKKLQANNAAVLINK